MSDNPHLSFTRTDPRKLGVEDKGGGLRGAECSSDGRPNEVLAKCVPDWPEFMRTVQYAWRKR